MDEGLKSEVAALLLEGYGVKTSRDFCALKPQEFAGLYTDLKAIAARRGLTDAEMEAVLEAILG